MKVLVAYGSKRGGTRGIAETIAATLRETGDVVDVLDAKTVRSLDGYEMAFIGGALYAGRWHKTARRLVKRRADALRSIPVWLFSSGPLDDSAVSEDIPPVGVVAQFMEMIGARGHRTFGGRLAADAKGFPASAMAKTRAGDWRNSDQIAAWAREARSATASIS
jgi:menaquinone-dependent protoporphyrinogen oxidase